MDARALRDLVTEDLAYELAVKDEQLLVARQGCETWRLIAQIALAEMAEVVRQRDRARDDLRELRDRLDGRHDDHPENEEMEWDQLNPEQQWAEGHLQVGGPGQGRLDAELV